MKVALLSCTSSKKPYKCRASEMYSESPRFALAYRYGKMTCDKVYILSAKYGLLAEDGEIEPYNETLKDKSTNERKLWSMNVLRQLNSLFSLQSDEFLVLAGVAYNEYLLPYLTNYELPLKGESLGNWIPKLKDLIDGASIQKEYNSCEEIHKLFNDMPRLSWNDINNLPFNNGIYIMFETGEQYLDMDRIVRVGTHNADNRLKKRLKDHFISENKDGSIFRKNIGKAILHSKADPYEEIWEHNTSRPEIRTQYADFINPEYQNEIEKKVTAYMKENFTFVCFQVDTKQERLRLEEGLITTLNQTQSFKSSNNWLGLNSPIKKIVGSGLWNVQGLNSTPLSIEEIHRIKSLIGSGNSNFKSAISTQVPSVKNLIVDKTNNKAKVTTADIRNYIEDKLNHARKNGLSYFDIVSGDIHREMNLENKMPSVCSAMYQLKSERDEVLNTTPSGKSSTIKIKYYL